jgi:hypothetical protein
MASQGPSHAALAASSGQLEHQTGRGSRALLRLEETMLSGFALAPAEVEVVPYVILIDPSKNGSSN